MEKEKKSVFNIVTKILIVILCIAIVVQICVMIYFRVEKNKLKEKNNNISQSCICEQYDTFTINLIK